jgi:hypothetical protein
MATSLARTVSRKPTFFANALTASGRSEKSGTTAFPALDRQQRVVYGRTICGEERRLDDPQRPFTRG